MVWIWGSGLSPSYKRTLGREKTAREIIADFEGGDKDAALMVDRLEDRLARGLATVINLLDPDVIVLGGGLSQASHLYESVPKRLGKYVFGGEADTPIVKARFGDSSGVRGAAWLWPLVR